MMFRDIVFVCSVTITFMLMHTLLEVDTPEAEPVSCSCVCDDCQCGPDGYCGCQLCVHGGKE